jgi:hypothetical protein
MASTGATTMGSAFQVQIRCPRPGGMGAWACAGAAITKQGTMRSSGPIAAHSQVAKNTIGRVSQMVAIKARPDSKNPA